MISFRDDFYAGTSQRLRTPLTSAWLDGFAVVFLSSPGGIVEHGCDFTIECVIEVTRNVFVVDLVSHCRFDDGNGKVDDTPPLSV
jgi:hypothetical protein